MNTLQILLLRAAVAGTGCRTPLLSMGLKQQTIHRHCHDKVATSEADRVVGQHGVRVRCFVLLRIAPGVPKRRSGGPMVELFHVLKRQWSGDMNVSCGDSPRFSSRRRPRPSKSNSSPPWMVMSRPGSRTLISGMSIVSEGRFVHSAASMVFSRLSSTGTLRLWQMRVLPEAIAAVQRQQAPRYYLVP